MAVPAVRPVPPSRFNIDAWFDPVPGRPGRIYCRHLGALDDGLQFGGGADWGYRRWLRDVRNPLLLVGMFPQAGAAAASYQCRELLG